MQELKVLPGSICHVAQSVAEDTVTECHNQKNCQDVSQSKQQRESTAIRGIFRKCQNQKVLSGSVAIMCTDFKGVLLLKVHEGVSQSKILPGSVTI